MSTYMIPRTHRTLTSAEQITAYLHSTRIDILAVLRDGPSTVTQIASLLGVHPANLTRHVRVLVEAGLVELDHTRDTGRNLEKYYRSIADTFDVAPEADGVTSPHKVALEFARSDLSAALTQLPEALSLPVLSLVAAARVRRDKIPEYFRRLEALAREFESSNADSDDGENDGVHEEYHINLNVYPGSWNTTGGTFSLKRKEQLS